MTSERRIFTVWMSASLSLAVGLALSGCQKKTNETARAQARSVSVVTVQAGPIEGGLTASGVLVPREDTAVFPQITGYRVTKVLADEASWVRAGQPLVQLDDTLLRAQLVQQQALAAQQQSLADRADAEAARVRGLDNQGLLSEEQIQARRFAATTARAQARAQEAVLQDTRTREGLMIIRAPCAGLVIERTVRLGDLATTALANPWFRIAKDGQIELQADVSEETLGKLRPGDRAAVTLADGDKVSGAIRLVSPRVDANTKLGRVRITLPVRSDVRAGGYAEANFVSLGHLALTVPATAVRYDAEGAAVMAVGADGRLVRAPVTTGQRGGGIVELISGPPAGTRVVAKAGAMFTPGDFVRIAPQAAPAR
ncbi:MAG TPA: efflux RND transporter periplasmic adaptor subunit [Caulobacteraceae bacterium]